MQYRDNLSESGAFYIIPNKHGPGKTIVRRPHPPPTSAPLDDDFDAFTQAPTTARGLETGWDDRCDKVPCTSTTSQLLDDNFDAITYTETRGPGTVADSDWNARDRLRARARIRPQSSNPIRYRVGTDGEASPTPDGDTRTALGAVEARRIFDSPQTGSERRRVTRGRLGSPIARKDPNDHGPGRGRNFEIINRRILEDGPERTVTISTWRQEVARSVSPETPMSVYYVNARDYAEGNDGRHTEGKTNLDNNARQTRRKDDRIGQSSADTSPKGNNEKRKGKEKGWPSVDKRTSSPRAFSDRSFSPRSERITSPSNLSSSPEAKGHVPPRTVRPHRANTHDKLQNLPRGSTPSRERQISMNLASNVPPRSSTPIRALPHPSSFHPTESGSTISSIRATSLTSFENILASCQPSLLHTTPVLARLGIKREEHLRAVGRLSEETRDREVREEALRMGLTVMEWAILLDKLQSL